MAFMREIRRQPRQKKVGKVIETKVAGGTSPEITLFENGQITDEGGGSNRAREGSSGLPAKPRRNPKQTGNSHPKEDRTPAVFRNQQTRTERANGRPKLQARSNHGIGQP